MNWDKLKDKNGRLDSWKTRRFILSDEYLILLKKFHWCKNIREIYYCYNNNIINQPKCYCGNNLSFKQQNYGYGIYCSNKCSTLSIKTQTKYKQTCFKKYGTENPIQSELIKDKIKQTCLEKYGLDHYNKTDLGKTKYKQTCFKKYGVKNYSYTKQFKEKFQQTCFEKYGTIHPKQKHFSKDTIDKLNDPNWLKQQHYLLEKPLVQIGNELGLDKAGCTMGRYFKKYNIEVRYFENSQGEKELFEFIKSLLPNVEVIANDRSVLSPYELDIYIPELKLAFEYDGSFWHKNKREQDRWKTFCCNGLGITLYHIKENHWIKLKYHLKNIIEKILMKRFLINTYQ